MAWIRTSFRLSVLSVLFGVPPRRGLRLLFILWQQGGSAFESGQALRNHCPDCRVFLNMTGPPEAVESFVAIPHWSHWLLLWFLLGATI